MTNEYPFSKEVGDMLYATHDNPITNCVQCGTCSGSCPAVEFMDNSPRKMIGMIRANMKEEVLASNTYWSCASCYQCTVRCPAGIDIAELMYALKRYSMWRDQHKEGLIGPAFSESFIKMIINSGRSYEPILAATYLPKFSASDIIQEAITGSGLIFGGKMNLIPKKIKRIKNLQNAVRRIVPIGELS